MITAAGTGNNQGPALRPLEDCGARIGVSLSEFFDGEERPVRAIFALDHFAAGIDHHPLDFVRLPAVADEPEAGAGPAVVQT